MAELKSEYYIELDEILLIPIDVPGLDKASVTVTTDVGNIVSVTRSEFIPEEGKVYVEFMSLGNEGVAEVVVNISDTNGAIYSISFKITTSNNPPQEKSPEEEPPIVIPPYIPPDILGQINVFIDAVIDDVEIIVDARPPTETGGEFTIQYNLDGVISTSTQTTVMYGETFSTIIGITDSETVMGPVTVMMAGIDITSTAYNSGSNRIIIPRAVGNIVITASAVYPPSDCYIIRFTSNVDYRFRFRKSYGSDASNDYYGRNLIYDKNSNPVEFRNGDKVLINKKYSFSGVVDDNFQSNIQMVDTTMDGADIRWQSSADPYIFGTFGDIMTGNAYVTATELNGDNDSRVFSITWYVRNAIIGNQQTTIIEGSSYQSMIKAVTGFKIESVRIIMSGSNITDSVYDANTGNIYIKKVTGNITIEVNIEDDNNSIKALNKMSILEQYADILKEFNYSNKDNDIEDLADLVVECNLEYSNKGSIEQDSENFTISDFNFYTMKDINVISGDIRNGRVLITDDFINAIEVKEQKRYRLYLKSHERMGRCYGYLIINPYIGMIEI